MSASRSPSGVPASSSWWIERMPTSSVSLRLLPTYTCDAGSSPTRTVASPGTRPPCALANRSEEHTSELQSHRDLHSFPTRRSSDLLGQLALAADVHVRCGVVSHEDGCEPWNAASMRAREFLDAIPNPGTNLGGDRLAVDDRRRHLAIPAHGPSWPS